MLEDGANVFKLVGPLMVKQELEEARGNVAKRLEFIAQEQ
jgi:prefoldin beta subunit